jgi:hypothetical protein
MSTTPAPNESRQMLKWLHRNRLILLDLYRNQLLLGREVVFDVFNIEFRQPDEQIIFTRR